MKIKIVSVISVISVSILSLNSCTDEGYKVTPHPVKLNLEANGLSNPLTILGKVLFYDTHLSVNNGISCGSCHSQAHAFSDTKAFSSGFENNLTSRNTPPIQNLDDDIRLFWDGRENLLQSMVLMPILNHVEMGMDDEAALVERVRTQPYYHDLFEKAFGAADVSADKIAAALSQFVKKIRTSGTRADLNNLSALEKQGKQLFFEKYECNSCHLTQLPEGGGGYGGGGGGSGTDAGFINIGLDMHYTDPGRQNVTHKAEDAGKFKIPNLRNVALTAPYMHDGRFATLEQVMEHYSHGMANHPNLDERLKNENGTPKQLEITQQEEKAIIAFLNAMTDFNMISDKTLSNPFH
ncbi:MAG TPA: cytochrome c peroxidase [Bacteroidia bacterium]|nr:cytochrome c peroxidase [Bacteroidia bacterium]